jgi:hypothetical protein
MPTLSSSTTKTLKRIYDKNKNGTKVIEGLKRQKVVSNHISNGAKNVKLTRAEQFPVLRPEIEFYPC